MEPIIYSETAEKTVLGALIINPDALQEVTLRSDDFYIERNRTIWHTINGLSIKGITPDIVTIISSLEKQGKLEEVGGVNYLTDLIQAEGYSYLATQYAMTVQDYGRRRRALLAASELAKQAYDLKSDMTAVTAEIMQALTMDVSARHGALPISVYVSEFFDETQELIANPKDDLWGLSTGYKDYDKATGGLQSKDGEVLLVAGEPAVGKSIFTAQMALELAQQAPGAYYSLEMRASQVIRRIISARAKFATHKLKTGRMSETEVNQFVSESEKLAGLNLYMSDEAYLTTDDLRADIARLKSRYNIKWFVLDYIYLLSDNQGSKMSETDRTTLVSAAIKKICRNFEVAGVIISSVSKAGMDGITTSGKSAVRGSGQQLHDADVILFIRQDANNKNIINLSFEKGREIEQKRGYFSLYKHDGYPYLENMTSKDLNP